MNFFGKVNRLISASGGGILNCSDPANDLGIYGKFSVSWTGSNTTDHKRRLIDWLNLNNTVPVLNSISCPTIVNFVGTVTTPIIVTSDTTIISCGEVNVQYVKVQNGAKLILDAAGEVNINSDVEAESGSELEIK